MRNILAIDISEKIQGDNVIPLFNSSLGIYDLGVSMNMIHSHLSIISIRDTDNIMCTWLVE